LPKGHSRTGNVGSENELKVFFQVSEGRKLIQNFLQSLEPSFMIGGCRSISPVHLRPIRFTDLGYFFPKVLDTL
jgi:hypothetical protein